MLNVGSWGNFCRDCCSVKHGVIKQPPPPIEGGFYMVTKDLPEDLQFEIFDCQPPDDRPPKEH